MPQPIVDYFGVSFRSKKEAEQFSLQALNACTGPLGIQMMAGASRPVVLQSLMPQEGIGAFVSAGAAQLLKHEGAQYDIATAPTSLGHLPDGLALLAGDQADYSVYLARGRARDG